MHGNGAGGGSGASSGGKEQRSSIVRIANHRTEPVRIWLDGVAIEASEGQSVLTVILEHKSHVRLHESSGEPRAGFCLMGACQDCWVWLGRDRRGRACTTAVVRDAEYFTTAPPDGERG
jgi:D-hydroxyproline dehydrogenase subunit gamma